MELFQAWKYYSSENYIFTNFIFIFYHYDVLIEFWKFEHLNKSQVYCANCKSKHVKYFLIEDQYFPLVQVVIE